MLRWGGVVGRERGGREQIRVGLNLGCNRQRKYGFMSSLADRVFETLLWIVVQSAGTDQFYNQVGSAPLFNSMYLYVK